MSDLVVITANDLKVVGDGPRMPARRLGERLQYSRPTKIRELIGDERIYAELMRYGPIPRVGEMVGIGSGAQREVEEFWLNEAQCLIVCMMSRTDVAPDVRQEIVTVFMAWRRGELAPCDSAPVTDEMFAQIIETQLQQGKDLSWVKGALAEISRTVWQSLQVQSETAAVVQDLANKGRKDPTPETIRIHGKVVQHFCFGFCPFNEDVRIMDDDGNWLVGADGKLVMDIHHQYNKNNNALEATIPLCRDAHRLVEKDNSAHRKLDDVFDKYQANVARMMAQSKQLKLI